MYALTYIYNLQTSQIYISHVKYKFPP